MTIRQDTTADSPSENRVIETETELTQAARAVGPDEPIEEAEAPIDEATDAPVDHGVQLDALLPYLHAMARRLTGNAHDASDLVQDALVRAIRALPGLTAGSDLRPWLATIVRHLHVDRIRQLAREPPPVPLDEASLASMAGAHDDGAGHDERADRPGVDHLQFLDQALDALPEDFRRVFVLHELEGRSYRDIADSLGIPLATVGTRLSRARLKLRGLLGRGGKE